MSAPPDQEDQLQKFDYGEACPISMAASVICERWNLQIMRELFFGATRYSEIQKHIPNISPSILRDRLRFLEENDLVLRKRATANRYEYFLTPSGKALAPVLTEIGKWGMRWASVGMTEKQNTASGLVRDLAGAINLEELPSCDTVVEFTFTDVEDSPTRYIHVQNDSCQVCDTNLGFETDVYITVSIADMTKIWYGELDMHVAMENQQMRVSAAPVYLRNIKRWLRISSFTTDNPTIAPA